MRLRPCLPLFATFINHIEIWWSIFVRICWDLISSIFVARVVDHLISSGRLFNLSPFSCCCKCLSSKDDWIGWGSALLDLIFSIFWRNDFCINSNAPSTVIQRNTDTNSNLDANIGCPLGEIYFCINSKCKFKRFLKSSQLRQSFIRFLPHHWSNAPNFLSKGPVRGEDWQFIR